MEIIFALILLGLAGPTGAVVGDKPTRKRVVKFVDAHVLSPLGREVKQASLAPNVIPATYTGKLDKRDKNWEAENKLCVIWQDAYDWFATPNALEVLAEAKKLRDVYMSIIGPAEARLREVRKDYEDDDYGYYSYRHVHQAEENVDALRAKHRPKYTPEQQRVMEISDKYGWELIDNGLIRNINKGTSLAVDPIVYAL